MAMLNMLYNCLSGNKSQKKMFFKVHILYIDEGRAVYGWSQEEAERHRTFFAETCKKYNFTYTILALEKVMRLELDTLNTKPEEGELDSAKYKQFHEQLPVN